MNKIAIITGGKGFIGRILTVELLNRGYTVYHINNESDLAELTARHFDKDSVSVIHAAWRGTSGEGRRRFYMQADNVLMSINYAQKLLGLFPNARNFINIGSFVEHDKSSHYSMAKAIVSNTLHTISRSHNVPFVNAMLTNVYGPSEGESGRLVSTIVRKMLNGEKIEFDSNGLQPYEFMYETDAAHILADIVDNAYEDHNVLVTSRKTPPLNAFDTYINQMAYALKYDTKNIHYGNEWADGVYFDYFREAIANRFKLSDWKVKVTVNMGVREIAKKMRREHE